MQPLIKWFAYMHVYTWSNRGTEQLHHNENTPLQVSKRCHTGNVEIPYAYLQAQLWVCIRPSLLH